MQYELSLLTTADGQNLYFTHLSLYFYYILQLIFFFFFSVAFSHRYIKCNMAVWSRLHVLLCPTAMLVTQWQHHDSNSTQSQNPSKLLDNSRSTTCPSLPGCMICIGPVLHTGSIFSSSRAAARGMDRGWGSPALPNSAHPVSSVRGSLGFGGPGKWVDMTWGTRWEVEFLATLMWKREEDIAICQGWPYYEVVLSPPARAEPLKRREWKGLRRRNPHPFSQFLWILDPKHFLVKRQHLSNSCYLFGIMVMKNSNGIRNG